MERRCTASGGTSPYTYAWSNGGTTAAISGLAAGVYTVTVTDATGATVYLTTGKLRQRADVLSGAGYSSQNDPCVYFGLGAAAKVDKLEVVWPSGAREVFDVPGVDRTLTLDGLRLIYERNKKPV